MSVEWLLVVVCLALVSVCVMCWRFTGVLSDVARSSSRSAERWTLQRERFVQQCMEKLAVKDNPDATLKVAHLHGQEAIGTTRQHLQSENQATRQRVSEAEVMAQHRDYEAPNDPGWSEKDAHE